jgi:non-specific serine/threonine protein kinase
MGLVALEARGIRIEGNRTLEGLRKRVEEFSKVRKVAPTKGFQGTLRDYQVEGLSWLTFLHDFAFSGILADEMGLGKTVQTLAFLQLLKDSKSVKRKLQFPALIVTPTSVMTNWVYEARRFTPELKVLLLHGPRRRLDFARIPEHDLIITSYALLRLDRTDLERQEFSYVILDEAQNIKNPSASVTRAAKSISALRKIALTGTPTENRALELWSIFDFLMPGYLGGYDFFKRSVEKSIVEQGVQSKSVSALQRKIRPFVLRRAKAEVEKQLPKKIESELVVPLAPSQMQIYNAILSEVRPELDALVEKKGIKGASISILAALLRLRQVCNHPRSISAFRDDVELESGKFELFKEVVTEALDSGRKLLVFSQFLDMLSLMEDWLNEIGANYLRLDGASKNRQDLIDQFSSDEKVRLFLISLKAGGTGLNLSAADTVILYDPWWNPAVENQAIDRAHRIGQKRSVQVYRLITEDTIEQKIMLLKARKAELFSSLIEGGESKPFELSSDDLQELFKPLG